MEVEPLNYKTIIQDPYPDEFSAVSVPGTNPDHVGVDSGIVHIVGHPVHRHKTSPKQHLYTTVIQSTATRLALNNIFIPLSPSLQTQD